MNIPDHILKQLISSLSKPRWYKGGIKACCPFHDENTPSFTISELDSGVILYYCFGCGSSGTVNKLFKHFHIQYAIDFSKVILHNKHTPTSHRETHQTYRVDVSFGFPAIFDYFLERGITEAVCKLFNFSFDFSKNAAVLPVYTRGYYLGRIYRYVGGNFRYYIESVLPVGKAVWGIDQVDPDKPTYIVEGILDAATLWSEGFQAVALCNKTWKDKVDILGKLKQPICIPDNFDPQSTEIFNQLRKKIGGELCFVPPQYKDVNDFYLGKKFS